MSLRRRVALACASIIVLLIGSGNVATGAPTEIFFSEYIEGSSNNKALEIYNGTAADVNLGTAGYSVQMFFNGSSSAGLTINLNGSVARGDVFVLAHSSAVGDVLAHADQTNGAGWFNGDDAVVLRRGTTVIDVIGQIGSDPGTEWGTGDTSTADNTLRRKTGIEAGDGDGADAFDPAVQWSGFANNTFNGLGFHTSGGDAAPRVASSTPANNAVDVALDSNVTVVFSEPVTTAGGAFAISCTTSGGHPFAFSGSGTTYTLDPATDFARDESCTVTVTANGVADVDTDDPPDTMAADARITFTTLGVPATIMQIQGSGHNSPLRGRRVADVPGVVTAIRPSSFWMQDATGDGNSATSDGVLVFGVNTSSLTVGMNVRVNATVTEFGSGDNLTITELERATVTPAGPGAPIAPTVLGAGGRTQPNVVIEDDAEGDLNAAGEGGNVFDFGNDGIDFYETLEGMLVQVNDASVVGATRSFGEITLLADRGANATGLRTARGGILLAPTDANPERIIVDDEILRDRAGSPRPSKAMPDMNVGAQLTTPVAGPLDYSFENYKIQALTTPVFVDSSIQREIAAPARPRDLTVATFNLENLTAGNPQSKFEELASMIVDNLRMPAIIGVEEVQDDNGTTDNGLVAATQTWNKLIDALEAVGAHYAYRQIDPVNNQDGGAPGGNIRVGFLFRTDLPELRFVDRPGGTSTNEVTVEGPKNHPRLSFSPGRLGTQSTAFAATRKSLAGEFVWKDRTVFVVVNHFSSKNDDQGIFSRWQPPTNFSEGPRHGQAQVVNDFVDEIIARDKDANVVVLGDINDFEFSRTIEILEGDVLTTLMDILPSTERYSYVFEGNSQVLDQILVSNAILKRDPEYDVVHVNAEFADSRQASDHDPQVAYVRPKGTGEETQ
jgi:predicted extracellular nuclease